MVAQPQHAEIPAIVRAADDASYIDCSQCVPQACPLRARSEERLRLVTVAHGQTIKILAGSRISRWQEGNATDFPS